MPFTGLRGLFTSGSVPPARAAIPPAHTCIPPRSMYVPFTVLTVPFIHLPEPLRYVDNPFRKNYTPPACRNILAERFSGFPAPVNRKALVQQGFSLAGSYVVVNHYIMIKLRIKQLLEMKSEKFPRKALKGLGISDKVASKYLNNQKHTIGLRHVESLCLFLRCEPSELFEWIPDKPGDNDPTHPLQKIKPKQRFKAQEILKKMTPDEIQQRLLGNREGQG